MATMFRAVMAAKQATQRLALIVLCMEKKQALQSEVDELVILHKRLNGRLADYLAQPCKGTSDQYTLALNQFNHSFAVIRDGVIHRNPQAAIITMEEAYHANL